jgi:hypothetical protein
VTLRQQRRNGNNRVAPQKPNFNPNWISLAEVAVELICPALDETLPSGLNRALLRIGALKFA